MNKEFLNQVKGVCEAVDVLLNNGKTPQEIADIFGVKTEYVTDDDEYDYLLVDFPNFGITFEASKDAHNKWRWVNEDEVWVYQGYPKTYNWKEL